MFDWSAAFDQTLKVFKVNATELAEKAGLSRPLVSRFRHGKQPTATDSLNALLKSLPVEATIYFISSLCRTSDIPVRDFINQMTEGISPFEIVNIILLLTKKINAHKITTIDGEVLVIESPEGAMLGIHGSREAIGKYLATKENVPDSVAVRDIVKEPPPQLDREIPLTEEELKDFGVNSSL